LNIIDEVSFAGYHTALVGTSHFLQKATECNEFQYGKAAMCFLDFANLKLSTKTIYKQVDGIYWEQSLNCLVELKGTHRYKNCPVLQRIMPMRNEGLQKQIVKSWIQELSTGTTWNARLENTRFATFYNAKRCGINIDVFRSYLEKHHTDCTPDNDNIPKSAIVIKSKALWGKWCLSHLNRVVFFEKFGSRGYEQSK
jgi:hypothetical protein